MILLPAIQIRHHTNSNPLKLLNYYKIYTLVLSKLIITFTNNTLLHYIGSQIPNLNFMLTDRFLTVIKHCVV